MSFELDEEDLKYAESVLKETEEDREKSLKIIGDWLENEAVSLQARRESRYVLPFLRGCKFKIEKSKRKITNYYTMKRDEPTWYRDRNPDLMVVKNLVKNGIFIPLKHLNNGKLVVIIRVGCFEPGKFDLDDFFKLGTMLLDIATMEAPKCQVYGITAIFDVRNVTYSHAKIMTPSVVKRMVFAFKNYPYRPKQFEFVNSPLYLTVVLKVFKSFMGEKMRERISVHYNGLGELHLKVLKEILPEEYGGNGDSLETLMEYWLEKLGEYKDWFLEDEQFKARMD